MVTISLMGSMHVWCQTMLIGSMLFVVLKPKQSILWCWLVCDWQTHSVPSKICRNNTVVAGSSSDSNRKLPIDLVNDVLVRLRVLYNLLVNISVDKYSTFLKIPKWTIGKGHLVGPMGDQDQIPSTKAPTPKPNSWHQTQMSETLTFYLMTHDDPKFTVTYLYRNCWCVRGVCIFGIRECYFQLFLVRIFVDWPIVSPYNFPLPGGIIVPALFKPLGAHTHKHPN